MKQKQIWAGLAAFCLTLLCGCGGFEDIALSESDINRKFTSSLAAEPAHVTAEVLSTQAAGVQTILPMTADFFSWCVQKTGDPDVLDRIADKLRSGGITDADWYSLIGMTAKAANDLYSNIADTAANIHVLDGDGQDGISFTFGGDISFADNWHTMQYLKTTEHGISDCISPFLIEKMQKADISSLNNEFCFSDRGSPMPNKMYTFRAAPANVSVYHELGVDIVDVTNNHCFDFGQDAFLDTLDTLSSANVQYMGAGRDISEASRPQYYIVEGKKIAFVAATRAEKFVLTPEAGTDSPGVLRCYDPAAFIQVIREAKQQADFVIANIHWGTEDSHALEEVQTTTARQYIDAGADLIIGSHAHCLQGIEYYKHVPIIYNLGNYWFSKYDIDTGLLGVTLNPDDSLGLVFYPATQRNCKTTYVGGEEEGSRILRNMRSYSINADFAEDGTVTEQTSAKS
ncbi:MAG: CapA family protein [Oscillospiraceae bacterium]|nr:CapA family protein [Oscillospiraceae bacterium]